MGNKNSGLSGYLRSGEDYTASITKFEFQELAAATRNFAPESLLGKWAYGRTFKGFLKSRGQDVAIRQVNEETIRKMYRYEDQSTLSTIHARSLLHHPNIVDMIGYSINGKGQIFLVYDFMPLGSLKDYLRTDLPPINNKPLDWSTRMKIAAGAAKGLKYLHKESHPPVIHGNIKPSNILLCDGYHPKLSDFLGCKERIPEFDASMRCRFIDCQARMDFKRTQQSDIYGFGLVLLNLISGRMAEIQYSVIERVKRRLVEGKEFTTVADPLLKGHYPEQGLYQALYLAAECLQREDVRPCIEYIVTVLSNLASEIYDPNAIQINRAGTLTIGDFDKDRLREQWRHAFYTYY